MNYINRNGIRYKLIQHLTFPAQPEVPATYDENGNELTPLILAKDAVYEDVETGEQCGIEIDIPSDANIAIPHLRKAELVSMTFDKDLEIVMNIQINYYNVDGSPMAENNNSESDEYHKRLFQSYMVKGKTTRDSYVNASTGQLVTGDTTGISVIPEKVSLQQFTTDLMVMLGIPIANEKRPMQLVYQMIKFNILQIINRINI